MVILDEVLSRFFLEEEVKLYYDKEFMFESLDDLKKQIHQYIYNYNNIRTVKLKGLSPFMYRQQSLNQVLN